SDTAETVSALVGRRLAAVAAAVAIPSLTCIRSARRRDGSKYGRRRRVQNRDAAPLAPKRQVWARRQVAFVREVRHRSMTDRCPAGAGSHPRSGRDGAQCWACTWWAECAEPSRVAHRALVPLPRRGGEPLRTPASTELQSRRYGRCAFSGAHRRENVQTNANELHPRTCAHSAAASVSKAPALRCTSP